MVKNKLLEIRLCLGFKNQKEFAEFLGIDSWLYHRYENNKSQPNADNLLTICTKTGKRIEDVLIKIP